MMHVKPFIFFICQHLFFLKLPSSFLIVLKVRSRVSNEFAAAVQDSDAVRRPTYLGAAGRQSAHSASQGQNEDSAQKALESGHVHLLPARLQALRRH